MDPWGDLLDWWEDHFYQCWYVTNYIAIGVITVAMSYAQ